MANEFSRNIQDASLQNSTAFPAAGANNSSATIDLGAGVAKHFNAEVEISWPAMAALADTKNVIFTLQDSADDSSYASIEMVHTITGAGGAGVAAGTKRFRLPSNVRQYLKLNAAEDAAGGNITASSYTLKLLF